MTFYHNWFRQLSIVNLPLEDRVRIEINFLPKSPRICRRILGVDADIVALVSKWFILDNSHYSTVRCLRCLWNSSLINTLRTRQNGRHFPDDIFKWNFLNENAWISIEISLRFVPRGPINNIPALVQIMAWRRPGDKPLSAPMMVNLLTHICVTQP